MNHGAGALSPLDRRRATLRARPSGLKGRCRDRCATDLRPALDPAASTAPHRAATRAAAAGAAARQARGAEHQEPTSNPYNQVSTVTGDCQTWFPRRGRGPISESRQSPYIDHG